MDLLSILSGLMAPQVNAQPGYSPDNNITNNLVRMGALPHSQMEYLPQQQPMRGGYLPMYEMAQPMPYPNAINQSLGQANRSIGNYGNAQQQFQVNANQADTKARSQMNSPLSQLLRF